jgi:acyl-CoA-binding protein
MPVNSNKGFVAIIGTVATVAVSTLFVYKKVKGFSFSQGKVDETRSVEKDAASSRGVSHRDLQLEEVSDSHKKDSPDDKGGGGGVPPQVRSRFEACAAALRSQKHLSQPQMLTAYALYKQATSGPCHGPAPNSLNLVATAKYKAWENLGKMDKMTAMQEYIDFVMLVEFTKEADDQADIIYYDEEDSKDKGDNNIMEVGGMGLKPSTLNFEQDEGNDFGMDDALERDLHTFAKNGFAGKLELLLETTPVNPNCLDSSHQTALHLAADRGSVECVSILLRHGADPKASDKDGISVLQTAVIAGHHEVCRLLLDSGADPDQPDCDGDTPRSCAQDEAILRDLFAPLKPEDGELYEPAEDDISRLDKITLELDDDGDI